MNQPWIYMCSPSQSPLPPTSSPSLIGIYFTNTSSLCQEFRQGTTGWLFSTPVSGASVGRLKGWGLESSKSLITHLSGGLCKLSASGLSSPLRGLLWMVSPHGSVWASSGSKGKHPKKESLVEAAPFFLLAMLGLHWWFKGTSLVVGTSLIMTCRLCCPVVCRILVPWPRIEPMTPPLQDRFLTTGPTKEVPKPSFLTQLQKSLDITSTILPFVEAVEKNPTPRQGKQKQTPISLWGTAKF